MDPSTMLVMKLILFEVILPIISLCIINTSKHMILLSRASEISNTSLDPFRGRRWNGRPWS